VCMCVCVCGRGDVACGTGGPAACPGTQREEQGDQSTGMEAGPEGRVAAEKRP